MTGNPRTPLMAVLLLLLFLGGAESLAQKVDTIRPDTTVDAGHFGEIKTAIYTNKTQAFLSCESGDMVVTIDFVDNFYGVIYANRDLSSPCKVHGDGRKVYTIRLPLKGCGTREDQKRTFINDIVVRFREGLIVDEDEVKTIICRYGPPVAPPPVTFPPIPPLLPEPPSIVAKPKRLTEAEIYVIICFLLFLALLLLGVGLAYYCLKRRNIKVVRKRRAAPSGPPSEITKLSSTLSAFDGFRIPRAAAHSMSGSEAALLTGGENSDTIPSDYPSESPSSAPSEVDDGGGQMVSASALEQRYQYENRAYSARDDIFTISGAANDLTERSLTTIYEHDDMMRMREEEEEIERIRRSVSGVAAAPPVYARIRKRQAELAMLEEEERAHVIPRVHAASVMESRSLSEALEEFAPPVRRTPPAVADRDTEGRYTRSLSEIIEPPAVYTGPDTALAMASARRHTIDDRYVTTVTETHTHEDVTRLLRETTAQHMRDIPTPPPPPPPLPPPQWDVLIRTYPPPGTSRPPSSIASTPTDVDEVDTAWEQLSYVSDRTGEPIWRLVTKDETLRTRLQEVRTAEEVETLRRDVRYEKLVDPQHWDVIIRILSAPVETERAPSEASSSACGSEISIPRSAASSSYNRGRRRNDWDARSRRSSLPPVVEDETDRMSLTPSQAEVLYGDDGYDDPAPGPAGFHEWDVPYNIAPSHSIAERSTTEIVEEVGDYYQQSHSSRRLRMRGRPPFLRSTSDNSDAPPDADWLTHRPVSPTASSSAASRRHRLLERSSTEIIMDSPIVAMMASEADASSTSGMGSRTYERDWRR